MSDALKEVQSLISSVELKDIVDVSGFYSCSVHPSAIPKDVVVKTSMGEPTFDWDESKKFLFAYIDFGIYAKKEDEPEESEEYLFEIHSTKTAIYSFSGKDHPSDEAAVVFCKTNAFYNTYAYFRETFQTMSMRMGLSPITLPVIKPFTIEDIKLSLTEIKKKNSE